MPQIEVGTHEVTVIGSSLSEKNGELVINVYFEDSLEDRITAFLHTSEAAWPYTEAKLKACGFDPSANGYDLSPLGLSGADGNPMTGNKTTIVVEDRVWATEKGGDGKTRRQVVQIGSTFQDKLDPDKAKDLTTKLRARLIAGREPTAPAATGAKKPARRPPPPAAAASSPAADDDVPF